VAVRLRRRRLARVAVEPARHVVRVHLLAPDEAGACLAQDRQLLGRSLVRRERGVELVGVVLARGDDLGEPVSRPGSARLRNRRRLVQP
jgi:hypothetical protein